MKKIVLAALVASGAMAAGNSDYAAISIGEATSAVTSGGQTVNDSKTAYSIALGHYYGDKGRVAGTYSHIDYTGINSDSLSLSYDFMLPVASSVSVFAGPSAGYMWLEDLSGLIYGGEAGAVYRINDAIEVEAGYRLMLGTGSYTVGTNKVVLDDVSGWYVGANFRF